MVERKPIISSKSTKELKKSCKVAEILWETWLTSEHAIKYLVTSNLDRSQYYAYEWTGKALVKIAKGSTPLAFRNKMKL